MTGSSAGKSVPGCISRRAFEEVLRDASIAQQAGDPEPLTAEPSVEPEVLRRFHLELLLSGRPETAHRDDSVVDEQIGLRAAGTQVVFHRRDCVGQRELEVEIRLDRPRVRLGRAGEAHDLVVAPYAGGDGIGDRGHLAPEPVARLPVHRMEEPDRAIEGNSLTLEVRLEHRRVPLGMAHQAPATGPRSEPWRVGDEARGLDALPPAVQEPVCLASQGRSEGALIGEQPQQLGRALLVARQRLDAECADHELGRFTSGSDELRERARSDGGRIQAPCAHPAARRDQREVAQRFVQWRERRIARALLHRPLPEVVVPPAAALGVDWHQLRHARAAVGIVHDGLVDRAVDRHQVGELTHRRITPRIFAFARVRTPLAYVRPYPTLAHTPNGQQIGKRHTIEAMLIYSMSASVDGFIADREGAFGWTAPSEELFRFHTALVRELDGYLLGRRLYETMLVWETDPSMRANELDAAFADAWSALPKIVFSRTLDSVQGNARLAEASLAEEAAAALEATDKDVGIGGAGLAAQAIELGLVDELRMFRYPVVIGGGTPFLPPVTEDVPLDLVETRTFGSRVIYERYGRARDESD